MRRSAGRPRTRVAASFLFLVTLALGRPGHSAFEEKPLSARGAALGESGAGDASDPDAWLVNPAVLRFRSRSRALLGHTQLLGDAALPFSAAALSFPGKRVASGFTVTDFGDALYGEREISAAAAVGIAPAVSAGVGVTGSFLRMTRYGNRTAFGLDAGVTGRPHDRVSLGVSVRRLNRPRLSGAPEALPSVTRVGAAVSILSSSRIRVDLVKPRAGPFSSRVGLELAPSPLLAVRMGGQSRPSRFTLGLGVNTSLGVLDYAFSSHPFLGDQHNVSFSIEWGNPSPEKP